MRLLNLSPISSKEALKMIRELNGYKIIKGLRGRAGINEQKFAEIITRVSALVKAAPEIVEMDINPLTGKGNKIVAVDARININKIS
jgi:acetyltransferase